MYLFSGQETKRVAWKFLQVRGVLHKLLPIRYQSMTKTVDESPPVSAEDEKVTYTRLLREPITLCTNVACRGLVLGFLLLQKLDFLDRSARIIIRSLACSSSLRQLGYRSRPCLPPLARAFFIYCFIY